MTAKVLDVLLLLSLSVSLYLIAAGTFLYFVLICSVYEILFRRRLFLGVSSGILAALVVYILGVLVFNISLIDVYSELLPFSREITDYPDRRRMIEVIYALYLLLPSIVIVIGMWQFFIEHRLIKFRRNRKDKRKSGRAKQKDKKTLPGKSSKTKMVIAFDGRKLIFCLELLAPLFIAAGLVFHLGDLKRKQFFEVNYYLRNRNWSEVLEIGQLYQNNDHMNHAYNRALFHLGLLPSDMFCYQQRPRCLLLYTGKDIFTLEQRSNIFYDLGTINHCELALAELVEAYGERPEILKKLAVIRMAKNDIDTARVYLGALSKTLFSSGWANDYLKRLEADPNLSTDQEVQRLRSLMPENDKVFFNIRIEEMLSNLLEKNRKNKMAFEYLMAFYMFRMDLNKIVQNVGHLDDFDYPRIPRHYEEAILTYKYFTKKQPNLKGRAISRETQQRFSGFVQLADLYRNYPEVAFSELAKKYGDTYQFYYAYEVSGLKNE